MPRRHFKEIPMDPSENAQAPPVDHSQDPVEPEAPVKPPMSAATMTPDEYGAAFDEQKAAALDAKEAAMKTRQAAEADGMKQRHEFEAAALAGERDELKAEGAAVRLYAAMWQRQAAELGVAGGRDVGSVHARHEAERTKLAHDTGFDIMPPTVGETTRPGYVAAGPGHPWIRHVGY
jgi:hypothetical protein